MPLVSIIIPVYCRMECIKRTVKEVLKQSLKDIEVICVDDGSDDQTWDVLKDLSKLDSRVIIFHKDNGGAGSARNLGIKESSGEYLFFLDSDDSLCSYTVIQELYEAAKKNEAKVCGGRLLILDDVGIHPEEATDLKKEGFVFFENHQWHYHFTRFIYKSSMIKQNGIAL